MPLTTSQKINEIKRSFNKHLEGSLPGIAINFDDADFTPPSSGSFLVVRFVNSRFNPCGIGGVVSGDTGSVRGRWHHMEVNLGAYSHSDPQKKIAGDLFDMISDLLKGSSIPLYDFTDPENPVSSGTIYLETMHSNAAPVPLELEATSTDDLSHHGYTVLNLSLILSTMELF